MEKISDGIVENVKAFVRSSGILVGNFHRYSYIANALPFFDDHDIGSPIEQILYLALEAIRQINYIDDGDVHEIRGQHHVLGLSIHPQYKIGKFRVDFLVTYDRLEEHKKIVVECDSQEFHDRDERERRYEKMRDRFLQREGYTVFRFTGSEIVKEPYRVACEIISHVTEIPANVLAEPIKDFAEGSF